MEAQAVPREAPGASGIISPRTLGLASDARLVTLVRQGNAAAFEAMYDRHHRAILSFCRHMLGDPEEAEDAVQHTFLAAYNHIISSDKTILLRPWLFTIARNRCYSVLRGQRDQPSGDLVEPATEGLSTQVQQREELRHLLSDMRGLPKEQRAALVLAELDTLSHEQVGDALGVPKEKVKALVFQARASLTATRQARDTDCEEIRRQLATLRGGGLRRGNLRRHLRLCPGCEQFRQEVQHQRQMLAILLPVTPTVALKNAVLSAASTGGAAAGAAAGGGLLLLKSSGALKGVAAGLVALLGAAGTVAVVHTLQTSPARPASSAAGHGRSSQGAASGSSAASGAQAFGVWGFVSPPGRHVGSTGGGTHAAQGVRSSSSVLAQPLGFGGGASGVAASHPAPVPASGAQPSSAQGPGQDLERSSPAAGHKHEHARSPGGNNSASGGNGNNPPPKNENAPVPKHHHQPPSPKHGDQSVPKHANAVAKHALDRA